MMNIVIAFLTQILYTLGGLLLFGFLIALCNKLFYRNMGVLGNAACYITGFIGTPVHECSHALFCVIFRHKINEIKLFQISSSDGTLGYVSHSYNEKNIYQRIGNFFIGVAPILVISTLLFLLTHLLVPNVAITISNGAQGLASNGIAALPSFFLNLGSTFLSCIGTWQFWCFLLLGIFLALHMTLSDADIKGAKEGLLLLSIALLVVDVLLGIISTSALSAFTAVLLLLASYVNAFLLFGLIISLLAVTVSLIIRRIAKRF